MESPTTPPRTRVLLIGATGFIGSRILSGLDGRSDVLVTILARRLTDFPGQERRVIIGDISDPVTLVRAVRDAAVVINASSYVGADPEMASTVNEMGTKAVIRACGNSTGRKLIQLSTTAVYGSGPHRRLGPLDAPYRPESFVSQSRAAADKAVVDAGGIVVRPNLVHGAGDRWFIPGAIRMFRTLGRTIENGNALLSMIDVKDLGLLVASLVTAASPAPMVLHAADPTPVSLAHLLQTIKGQIAPLHLHGSSTVCDARRMLEPHGFRPHQLRMLGEDNYYESRHLWDFAGQVPPGFQLDSEATDWYRKRIAPE